MRGEGKTLREPYGESLLVCVLAEDEALPVDPGIKVVVWAVEEQLKAHLRILREVDFGVHQRLHQPMIGAAIEITKHEGEIFQLGLCAQEG